MINRCNTLDNFYTGTFYYFYVAAVSCLVTKVCLAACLCDRRVHHGYNVHI